MRQLSAMSLVPSNFPQQCAYQPSFSSSAELGAFFFSVPFTNLVLALNTICRSISFLRTVIVDVSLWTERTVPFNWSGLAFFSLAAAGLTAMATSMARQNVNPVKILRLISAPLDRSNRVLFTILRETEKVNMGAV